jgi:glycosyltransferase involved in cell wall biosynthesis
MSSPPRVIFVDEQQPSFRYQWSDMPAEALARRGVPVERLSYERAVSGTVPDDLWQLDVVIVVALDGAGLALMRRMPDRAHRQARLVVVINDDMWSPQGPSMCAELGLDASVADTIQRLATLAVRAADAVVADTSPLVEKIRTMNPRTGLVPWVAPSADTWPAVRPRPAGVQRIGWCGLPGGREADFSILHQAYTRLAQERQDLRFVFWGARPSWASELGERVDFRPVNAVIGMCEYYQALAALELTLAVAPIAANPFNEARSAAKFVEAAAGAGCPLIASDFGPYRRLAEAGAPLITVPDDPADWYDALRTMLDDEACRVGFTASARGWVAKHATIDAIGDNWIQAIELARRPDADAVAPSFRVEVEEPADRGHAPIAGARSQRASWRVRCGPAASR